MLLLLETDLRQKQNPTLMMAIQAIEGEIIITVEMTALATRNGGIDITTNGESRDPPEDQVVYLKPPNPVARTTPPLSNTFPLYF